MYRPGCQEHLDCRVMEIIEILKQIRNSCSEGMRNANKYIRLATYQYENIVLLCCVSRQREYNIKKVVSHANR